MIGAWLTFLAWLAAVPLAVWLLHWSDQRARRRFRSYSPRRRTVEACPVSGPTPGAGGRPIPRTTPAGTSSDRTGAVPAPPVRSPASVGVMDSSAVAPTGPHLSRRPGRHRLGDVA